MTVPMQPSRGRSRPDDSGSSNVDDQILQSAAGADVRRPWLHSPASEWVTRAAQMSTAVAGAAYGLGWIIATRFYGHFGVSPEEAGVTFGWLAVRTFLIALVCLMLLLVVRYLWRTAEGYAAVAWTAHPRVVAAGLSLAAIAADLVLGRAGLAGSVWGKIVLIAIPLTLLVIVARRRLRPAPDAVTSRGGAGLWLRAAAGFLVGFVVTVLLVAPFQLADGLSDDIHAGKSVRLEIVPGIPVVHMQRLRLVAGGVPAVGATSRCFIRLGSSEGTSVYWDIEDRRVVRISDETATAVAPC